MQFVHAVRFETIYKENIRGFFPWYNINNNNNIANEKQQQPSVKRAQTYKVYGIKRDRMRIICVLFRVSIVI